MICNLDRTCREICEDSSKAFPSQKIESWEEESAYVLLGPPGAGKSTIFKHQAKRQGGCYVTARDFLTFDDRPEWHDVTLFIDGLDETRAGSVDGRTPLDNIRAKLYKVGCKKFRLSCREADWFGANDRHHLSAVLPDASIKVLRLDSLTDDDILKYLRDVRAINDPEDFVTKANDHGLHGLLVNPHSLNMLVDAVNETDALPKTRSEAFELACNHLLSEHNSEHRIASPDPCGIPDLMEACGKLCAVQMLTGAAGYALSGAGSDRNFLELGQLPGTEQNIFCRILTSKLFETRTECQAVPAHRQISEFLAARYLASLVGDGLPVLRILSLITGHDGLVVSELRGLSAWLAALCPSYRVEAFERDPIGTVLYGDVQQFSQQEKISLLNAIEPKLAENPRLNIAGQMDSFIGSLVSIDMENPVRKILTESTRKDSRQSLVMFLLEALSYGDPIPVLSGPLKEIIRDNSWLSKIRHQAIEVFERHHPNRTQALDELKDLAHDICAGRIEDVDYGLLGSLLSLIYPSAISESEVTGFLKKPQRYDSNLGYIYFWKIDLPEKSTPEQLAVVLDHLAASYDSLLENAGPYQLHADVIHRLPFELLDKFLEQATSKVDVIRLFHWLGTFSKLNTTALNEIFNSDQARRICKWLEADHIVWATLLKMSLDQCSANSDSSKCHQFDNCMRKEESERLLGATRPRDFGRWCLDQALEASNPLIANWLIAQVAECFHDENFDMLLSRQTITECLIGFEDLKEAFDERMDEIDRRHSNMDSTTPTIQQQQDSDQQSWHDHVKPYQDKLRGKFEWPRLLHELARVYFGKYINIRGDSPRARLNAVLAGDEALVDAVLCGFRNTVNRDDLPTDKKILSLALSKRIHYLALPFMAGMNELEEVSPSGEVDLDYQRLRLALAIYYTVSIRSNARDHSCIPLRWLSSALSDSPEIVADLLERFVLSQLRKREKFPEGIDMLSHSAEYAGVTKLAAIPLLQKFPAPCASGQLRSLDRLLLAARRHCGETEILELISQKLTNEKLDVAQRVHWLTAGISIAPEAYFDQLQSYVEGKERRIRFLAEALNGQFSTSTYQNYQHNILALKLIIRLVGKTYRPYAQDKQSVYGIIRPENNASEKVQDCIGKLAGIATEDASVALDELLSDTELRPWGSLIERAARSQNAARREAGFTYSDASRVVETLENLQPANPADLAAVTVAHLNSIAGSIVDGNTSDWKQYWNIDGYSRPENPHPENACRDTLLSHLRHRLQPLGIDAQPEGRYANDKRADIRVSYSGFSIPVEIKKSCSRDLFSALREQLIARYSRDPDSAGHGIYIVFWFGVTDGCRPVPMGNGARPENACELEIQLKATLSAEEKMKIQILVIDVSAQTPIVQ